MLTPSLIYAPLINEIIASGSELTGVVHITGGGVWCVANLSYYIVCPRMGRDGC